jgi:hypothetical protein
MGISKWVRDRHIYIIVALLLALLAFVIYVYQSGGMNVEEAKMYLQGLTAAGTLVLLYYAYFNAASKKEEDTARLELAVRPIMIWELSAKGGKAILEYKTIKHPIYDFRAILMLGDEELRIDERHLDVFEADPNHGRQMDVTSFIRNGLAGAQSGKVGLSFSFHSEVGGRYSLAFTKQVLRAKSGFNFQHRKIISAKYPWKEEKISFSDDEIATI